MTSRFSNQQNGASILSGVALGLFDRHPRRQDGGDLKTTRIPALIEDFHEVGFAVVKDRRRLLETLQCLNIGERGMVLMTTTLVMVRPGIGANLPPHRPTRM